MPQSGATMIRSAAHVRQRAADALRHDLRRLDRHVAEVDHAQDDGLAQAGELRAVELRLRGLDRHLPAPDCSNSARNA